MMMMRALILSLLLTAPVAWGEVVHTWVDEDGVTHFSDSPPPVGAADSRTLNVPGDFPEREATDAEYYSIANQWKRLQAERVEQERLALERERLRAEERAARAAAETQPEPVYSPPVVVGGYPGLGPVGWGRRVRPGFGGIVPSYGRHHRGLHRQPRGQHRQRPIPYEPRNRVGGGGSGVTLAGGGVGVRLR